tara:strand:+ start:4532 stop:5359 length:828 start_codon:yes stop_codon:yes gene_type:complete
MSGEETFVENEDAPRVKVFNVIEYCAEIATKKLTPKIMKISRKIKNEQAKKNLLSAQRNLVGRLNDDGSLSMGKIINSMADPVMQQEEGVDDFKGLIGDLNNFTFNTIFKVIKATLGVKTLEKGKDRMSVYAQNFLLYCKYKKIYNDEEKLVDPANCIFNSTWREKIDRAEKLFIGNAKNKNEFAILNPLQWDSCIQPKYFFIFDFISDSRNLQHEDIENPPDEKNNSELKNGETNTKDILTNEIVPGNYFTFSSIYILSIYALDELLDLMIEYL